MGRGPRPVAPAEAFRQRYGGWDAARIPPPPSPFVIDEQWSTVMYERYDIRCSGNGEGADAQRWAKGCDGHIEMGTPYALRRAPHATKHCEACMNAFFREVLLKKPLTREELAERREARLEASLRDLADAVRASDLQAAAKVEVEVVALEGVLEHVKTLEAEVRRLQETMRGAARALEQDLGRSR